jgi:hypothetical protein
MHFHGTAIQRPVPFYRVFKGTLFEQVDMAVDFVLSKLNRSVGTRAESNQAPVRHEIPPDVIREAIVNRADHQQGIPRISCCLEAYRQPRPGVAQACQGLQQGGQH